MSLVVIEVSFNFHYSGPVSFASFFFPEVHKTFAEFESFLKEPLPKSARVHRAWWGNDFTGHVQASAWLAVGWRVSSVDLGEQKVTLTREST